MKRKLLRYGVIALLLGAVAFGVAALGLVRLEASAGHWPVTISLLQFGKHRSISRWSSGIEMPEMTAEWMVLKGAGHYEIGCRPCHGSPGFPPPPVARSMLPAPPDLQEPVKHYTPRELFYVVKHGIKLTGMPAWPAQGRDDEIAAVVAFLKDWPNLDRKQYEQLVYGGEEQQGAAAAIEELSGKALQKTVVSGCARCHGLDGLGRGSPAFPIIAGQKEEYLAATLSAYIDGHRRSGLMQPVAVGLDEQAVKEVSAYYAKRPAPKARPVADVAAVERGAELALHGVPSAKVPACAPCHEPKRETNALYPRLDGQWAEYLVLQLQLFEQGGRGGTEWSHLMDRTVHRLNEQQMRDAAAFYAAQGE